jgi:cyclomaltodextrinase
VSVAAPAWVQHAVLWHVYPLGFLGAPAEGDPETEPVPRLRGLLPWLDYLIELGANALLLGPVFQSETHGYDTVDHFRVDSRLGSDADLDAVIEQAHARGIRVVLDGVFNHVGRGFGAFRDVEVHGAGSAYRDWFRWSASGEPTLFEGHDRLVALNHDSPAVIDHVVQVMQHWAGRGVDGWRLDAAYAVPTAFWAEVSARVRADRPDLWLLAEVIHGDYAGFVEQSGLHTVTQYELWKAVWSSLNDGNLFELAHALDRHARLLAAFVPQTFVGNHDVTRLASRLTDPRHVGHAIAVLCTVAGTPSVYAGDEQGLTGVKEDRVGGDDAVRPVFPEHPGELATAGVQTLRLHQQLIALRRRHPWLHSARTSVELLTNGALIYRSTGGAGEELLVALNIDDQALTWPLPPAPWRLEAGSADVAGASLTVPAHGWAVLGE